MPATTIARYKSHLNWYGGAINLAPTGGQRASLLLRAITSSITSLFG